MPSGIDTQGMPHGIYTVDYDFSDSRHTFVGVSVFAWVFLHARDFYTFNFDVAKHWIVTTNTNFGGLYK